MSSKQSLSFKSVPRVVTWSGSTVWETVILFLLGSIGFWQLGKTEVAKAFIIPMLVAGALILAIGLGIFYANQSRVTSFAEAHNSNAEAFVKSEITRTGKTMNEYQNIVFKVIPLIIVIASLLIIFIDKPV